MGAFQQMAARGFNGRTQEQRRQERRQFLGYPATEPTPNALPSQQQQQQGQGPARPVPAAGGEQQKKGSGDEADFDPGFPHSISLEEYMVNYVSDEEQVVRR